MAFVVLYDACVLHPAPVRDLLVRLGRTGLVRARWSETLLDECFRSPFNIEAKHPDDFLLDLIDLAPATVTLVVSEQAAALRSPPRTVFELLDTLRSQGLVQSVAKLRELLGPGGTE